MAVARAVLEKGTMMLLTASKVSASVLVSDEKNLSKCIIAGGLHFYSMCSFLMQRTELSTLCLLSMYSTTERHPGPPYWAFLKG